MCVVALAYDVHPDYRLVLAANRDEFHARAATALSRWEQEDSHLIAGKDEQSCGTWLGVSERGRVAVITNIRTGALPDPHKHSRGALVTEYLRDGKQPPMGQLGMFNPFSLLTIGTEGALLTANRPHPATIKLNPGLHGLSNGTPEEPWPRKDRLMRAFGDCLSDSDLPENLFALLASESVDDSIFIRDHIYGTRCSTVVLVGRDNSGTIIERRFGLEGIPSGETTIPFTI
jgi:uncharacterized protein with NRDE domain